MILLNNSNLDKFNCRIIEFNPDATKFGNMGNYWPKKSLQGVRINSRIQSFSKLNITILFYGENEIARENISRFLEESASSTFKYKNKYYDVAICENDNKVVILNNNTIKITLEFDVLKIYESEKSKTTTSNTTIIINSPKECYANLELVSSTNKVSCIVKVNGIDIVVKNIKANEVIYIGSGRVIAGGKSKIDDVDIWEFPRLKPGNNIISISENVNLTIKYNERW